MQRFQQILQRAITEHATSVTLSANSAPVGALPQGDVDWVDFGNTEANYISNLFKTLFPKGVHEKPERGQIDVPNFGKLLTIAVPGPIPRLLVFLPEGHAQFQPTWDDIINSINADPLETIMPDNPFEATMTHAAVQQQNMPNPAAPQPGMAPPPPPGAPAQPAANAAPSMNAPPPDTNAPPPDMSSPPVDMNAPPPGMGAPPPGMGAPPPGMGAPPPGMGAPPPDAVAAPETEAPAPEAAAPDIGDAPLNMFASTPQVDPAESQKAAAAPMAQSHEGPAPDLDSAPMNMFAEMPKPEDVAPEPAPDENIEAFAPTGLDLGGDEPAPEPAPEPMQMTSDPVAQAPAPEAMAPPPEAMAPAPEAMALAPEAMAPAPEAVAPAPEAVAFTPDPIAPPAAAMPPPAQQAAVSPSPPASIDPSEMGAPPELEEGKKRGTTIEPGPKPIDEILRFMIEKGASDLHVTSGEPIALRIDGEIARFKEWVIEEQQFYDLFYPITSEHNQAEFYDINDTDFAYEIPGEARFRVNLFRDRLGPCAVLRQIPSTILTFEQLSLPESLRKLCYLNKGLVVVTGPTGSGKSTTLAALVDHMNDVRKDHILTLEDPIEFVHPQKNCLIRQREIHKHTSSFARSLKAALREDPDIILVGELRDLETTALAIEIAETGHLVMGTLHTTTAVSTIDRVIDQFSADQQEQIRTMLSESLKGVVAQTLMRKIGGGRCAAQEILMVDSAVSALIREGKTHMIPNQMQSGKAAGNVLLNDALTQKVLAGLVEPKEAWMKSVQKKELINRFRTNNVDMKWYDQFASDEEKKAS